DDGRAAVAAAGGRGAAERRAPAGAVPRDGAHPPVRGAARQAVQARPAARLRAPLHRPGGDGDRRLRGPAPGRLHHLDPPRPRSPAGQGRGRQRDDGRALRQGRRPLPRQGRLHARRRLPARDPRHERHRRRRHPDLRRLGLGRPAPGPRHRHGRLLRRRRLQPGRLPRGAEPRGDLEAAGHLRLRVQRLHRVDPDGEADLGADPRARPGHERPGRGGRRQRRPRRLGGDQARRRARPRGGGPDAHRGDLHALARPQRGRGGLRRPLPARGRGRVMEAARP
ncbi:MAG: Acetoin dehydrogenase E1 component alpha-subunit, partial [uncultured Nocardioidaceae bacterium]